MGLPELDYVHVFRNLPGLYLVLDGALHIHEATDAYLQATYTRREAIVGKPIFEVFPDNPDDASADGTHNLRTSLERVLTTGQTDVMAVQKYDVKHPTKGGDEFEERYWSPINTPVCGESGHVDWIIHRVEDITDYVRTTLEDRSKGSNTDAEVFLRAQEIQLVNERLRQADQAKTTFLAHMSHEIRTPLNAILGLSHLALGQPVSAPMRDYLTKIEKAGATLLQLVDQILDLSKIESGALELESIPTSLEECALRVRLLFEERAAIKGIALRIVVGPDLPLSVLGDPLRLGQVLTNLLGNALKFTSAGEVSLEISVTARTPGAVGVSFVVADTGIGMTGEQQTRLFEAFSQGDSSMQRRYGGTGLGLRISQLIVQAMGGTIVVQSRPGEGTRFTFQIELPVDPNNRARLVVPARLNGLIVGVLTRNDDFFERLELALGDFPFSVQRGKVLRHKALSPVGEAEQPGMFIVDSEFGLEAIERWLAAAKSEAHRPPVLLISDSDAAIEKAAAFRSGIDAHLVTPLTASSLADTIMRLFFPMKESRLRPTAPENLVAGIAGYRVLVVEDNDVNRQIIQELLALVGVETILVDDGAAALERILSSPPETFSLVLMDVQMPGMDGYEATRRIRADQRYDQLPIIALTAHALTEERQYSLAAGMNDHLTKPISPDELYRVISVHGRQPGRAVLDSAEGLFRVQGNLALYVSLLERFQHQQKQTVSELRQLLVLSRKTDALAKIHTIKGLALNLGLRALGNGLRSLEDSVRTGQGDPLVLVESCQHCLDESLTLVRSYIRSQQPIVSVGGSGAPDDRRRALEALKNLVEQHDADAAEFLRIHFGIVVEVLGPTKAAALRTALSGFDFASALEVLDT